jgi:hypothetical protein
MTFQLLLAAALCLFDLAGAFPFSALAQGPL